MQHRGCGWGLQAAAGTAVGTVRGAAPTLGVACPDTSTESGAGPLELRGYPAGRSSHPEVLRSLETKSGSKGAVEVTAQKEWNFESAPEWAADSEGDRPGVQPGLLPLPRCREAAGTERGSPGPKVQLCGLPIFQGHVVRGRGLQSQLLPGGEVEEAFVLELEGLRVWETLPQTLRGQGHISGCNRGPECGQ